MLRQFIAAEDHTTEPKILQGQLNLARPPLELRGSGPTCQTNRRISLHVFSAESARACNDPADKTRPDSELVDGRFILSPCAFYRSHR
jgi:hypothetical protein